MNEMINNLRNLAPMPWYLDQCNKDGVCVKDVTGQVVFYEEFCFPDESPAYLVDQVTNRAIALAQYLVALSESHND